MRFRCSLDDRDSTIRYAPLELVKGMVEQTTWRAIVRHILKQLDPRRNAGEEPATDAALPVLGNQRAPAPAVHQHSPTYRLEARMACPLHCTRNTPSERDEQGARPRPPT